MTTRSLRKRAADLERKAKKRAELVKKVLRDYRETVRINTASKSPRPKDKERMLKKRRDVERANAEYMRVQSELERVCAELDGSK